MDASTQENINFVNSLIIQLLLLMIIFAVIKSPRRQVIAFTDTTIDHQPQQVFLGVLFLEKTTNDDIRAVDHRKESSNRAKVPSEVWGEILSYVGHVGSMPLPSIFAFRPLCRALCGGFDEWLVQELDQGLKKDGGVRLLHNRLTATQAPRKIQKLMLLALSKAPKELLGVVEKLEGGVLDVLHTSARASSQVRVFKAAVTSALGNVNSIEGPFFNSSGRLRTLDLSSMRRLTSIGSDALRNSTIKVMLPHSLKWIGNSFLANSTVLKLDLSHTAIEAVGDDFLAHATIGELLCLHH